MNCVVCRIDFVNTGQFLYLGLKSSMMPLPELKAHISSINNDVKTIKSANRGYFQSKTI